MKPNQPEQTPNRPDAPRSPKKPYTPPTLTDHGGVVEKTTGLGGLSHELDGFRPVME